MQQCPHVSLPSETLLYPDSAQILLHEDASHRPAYPECMFDPARFHEAVGFVKLDGGQRRIEVQVRRAGRYRRRFRGPQQRRPDAAASGNAPHIHPHAVPTMVGMVRREAEDLTAALLADTRDEE